MISEYTISRRLPFKVADAAVDVLVRKAKWVAHEMYYDNQISVMVWFPETRDHGCAEIRGSADHAGMVVCTAARASEFWAAVRIVEEGDGDE